MLFYAILPNSDISHIVTKYRDKSDIVGQIGHPQRGFGQNGHFGNVESAIILIRTYRPKRSNGHKSRKWDKSDISDISPPFGAQKPQIGHFENVESATYINGTYTRISDQTSLNRTFYP